MSEKPKPQCKNCGRPHYNFVACSMVDAFNAEKEEQARIQRNLAQPILRPRSNDRSNRYSRGVYGQQAHQVAVVRNRPPLHSRQTDRPTDSKPLASEVAADLLGG